jgi:hypothetical protein
VRYAFASKLYKGELLEVNQQLSPASLSVMRICAIATGADIIMILAGLLSDDPKTPTPTLSPRSIILTWKGSVSAAASVDRSRRDSEYLAPLSRPIVTYDNEVIICRA